MNTIVSEFDAKKNKCWCELKLWPDDVSWEGWLVIRWDSGKANCSHLTTPAENPNENCGGGGRGGGWDPARPSPPTYSSLQPQRSDREKVRELNHGTWEWACTWKCTPFSLSIIHFLNLFYLNWLNDMLSRYSGDLLFTLVTPSIKYIFDTRSDTLWPHSFSVTWKKILCISRMQTWWQR